MTFKETHLSTAKGALYYHYDLLKGIQVCEENPLHPGRGQAKKKEAGRFLFLWAWSMVEQVGAGFNP
jgi:hypothetical protein